MSDASGERGQVTDEQKERGSKPMTDLSGEPGKPLMSGRNEEVSR